MSELKMFRLTVTTQPPAVVRVYAVSKTQAQALFRQAFVMCEEATALQIEDMIKAGVPVIGKPSSGDPQQAPLELPQ